MGLTLSKLDKSAAGKVEKLKRPFTGMVLMSTGDSAPKWADEFLTRPRNECGIQVVPRVGRPESNYGCPAMRRFCQGLSAGQLAGICFLVNVHECNENVVVMKGDGSSLG